MPGSPSTAAFDLDLLDAPGFERRAGANWTIWVDSASAGPEVFAHSVARGLSDHPRWLSCRYLYDPEGSRIFQKITEQPEYYPTSAETGILATHATEIRALAGPTTLVELGSGGSIKTHHLLDAWTSMATDEVRYVPIDIDASVLTGAARELTDAFDIEVHGVATSYERGLEAVAGVSPLCLVFLGSTIGNFNPEETDAFLARLARTLAPEDAFLLGVDLVKDVAVLEAAYNDRAGWSEAFTRNLFRRMNRELGTTVDPESIDHVAYWNDRLERIEIHARFREAATIDLAPIERRFRVGAGEMVLTEISRKYRIEGIGADLARFGFTLEGCWKDAGERFGVLLFRRIESHTTPPARSHLAGLLRAARNQTLNLVEPLEDETLGRQMLPFLSPIAWDLGHMAEFEELWLVRAVDAIRSGDDRGGLESAYDAIETPRSARGRLEYPSRDALFERLREVRERAMDRLRSDEWNAEDPLLADGFVYRMMAQHEYQHQETFLQAIALMDDVVYEPAHRAATPRGWLPPDADMVLVPGGGFPMGAANDPAAYDNEKPRAWVHVDAFWIDAAPVTNGDVLAFIEAGGYDHRPWWSEAGWSWLEETGTRHPMGWVQSGEGWVDEQFGHREPLVLTRPVQHVSWHEAEAFARSVGKRLPTEAEWEKAAAWDPESRVARRWPWGDRPPDERRANLGARTFVPAPVGAYPDGRSFYGCHQMVGDVWEWTASTFQPYPGFEAFPYPEYSEAHFGDAYRILRGGSWATSPIVARNTFRNWDYPVRRQIFAGFRCALDA